MNRLRCVASAITKEKSEVISFAPSTAGPINQLRAKRLMSFFIHPAIFEKIEQVENFLIPNKVLLGLSQTPKNVSFGFCPFLPIQIVPELFIDHY